MRRRRALLCTAVLLLASAGYLYSQGAYHELTTINIFVHGFKLGTERLSGMTRASSTGIQVGGTDVSVTIAASSAQNAALTVPANSISGAEMSGMLFNVIFCGELAENGTTYLGPALDVLAGDASASTKIGSAACDALDNATEGTADAPLFANVAFKVMGLYCLTDGTLGAGETLVYTVRSAAADTVPVISCTISVGQTDCRSVVGTTTDIAAGATIAVQATETSNNADDNGLCRVQVALQ